MDTWGEEATRTRVALSVTSSGREVRIRAKRNLPALFFLLPFAALWAAVLVVGFAELTRQFNAVSLLVLAAIGILWLIMVATIGWYSAGMTVLRVSGGDLEIGFRMLRLSRLRRYAGSKVRGLSVAESPPYFAGPFSLPFPGRGKCIRFCYESLVVHAAREVTEADAQAILAHLSLRDGRLAS